MPYIGSGVQRFNTANGLTVSGDASVSGTTALTGNATAAGTLAVTGAVTANAGVSIDNITIDGTEIDLSSGDLTIDVAGELILDTDLQSEGNGILLKDDGTTYGNIFRTGSDLVIMSSASDEDLIFKGNDGGSTITALTLDMSAAGAAVFNSGATFADGCTITTADNDPQLTLVSTDADGNPGPVLKLRRNSSSVADEDVIGKILFHGQDGAGNDQEYVNIQTRIKNNAQGNEDGQLDITSMSSGTGRSRMFIRPTETVFNDDSVDLDFRVESNSNANMLFVDAGNDVVLINATSVSASGSPVLETNGAISAIKNHTDTSSSGNVSSGNGNQALTLINNQGGATNQTAKLGFSVATTGATSDGLIEFASTAAGTGHFRFYTEISNTISEKARLVGTEFLVGLQTANGLGGSQDDNGVEIGPGYININRDDTTEVNTMTFSKNGSSVGSIVTGSSSTTFNTSSDYRLKENVTDLTGATERLKQLKPKRFNFIVEADKTVDGFLAHEAQAVVPEAVTGTKDGTRVIETVVTPDEYDNDGNLTKKAVIETETVAHYQGIDQSKLVPLLVATIQELEARIVALENA